jgi:hypothetical protein
MTAWMYENAEQLAAGKRDERENLNETVEALTK